METCGIIGIIHNCRRLSRGGKRYGQSASGRGLIIAYAGFLLVFRYGMPFRVDTGGHVGLSAGIDPNEAALDARYRRWGWAGFALVTVGTVMQIAGTLI